LLASLGQRQCQGKKEKTVESPTPGNEEKAQGGEKRNTGCQGVADSHLSHNECDGWEQCRAFLREYTYQF
jgi:hypothetical protein